MNDTVPVAYKCCCMKEEVTLKLPARATDEAIESWMSLVIQAGIYLDHRRRSPHCKAQNMEYAKIMLPQDAEFIGQAIKEN